MSWMPAFCVSNSGAQLSFLNDTSLPFTDSRVACKSQKAKAGIEMQGRTKSSLGLRGEIFMKPRTLNGRRQLVKLAINVVSLLWVVSSARADANFLGVAAGDASSSEA